MTPDEQEDDLGQLAELFRRDPPPEPSDAAWAGVLDGIARAARPPRGAGWWGPIAGAAACAAVLALALIKSPTPVAVPTPLDDEPFPVALASEVQILQAGTDDADLVAVGQPLMGAFEVAAPLDVTNIQAEPNEDGSTPWLHKTAGLSIVIGVGEDDEN